MKKIKKFLSIFVLILLSIFILSGCKNNTDSPNNQSQKNQQSINKELPENNLSSTDDISTEVIGIAVNGDYILKLKNNTNNDIYIKHVVPTFYNTNGEVVKNVVINDSFFCIPANKEIVTFCWGYGMDFSNYSHKSTNFETSEPFYTFQTNLATTAEDTGTQLNVTVTNNSETAIDNIHLNVVYYKDGKIIGIEDSTSSGKIINPNGGQAVLDVSYPLDKKYAEIPYDSYEIYIVSAYSTNQ